MLCDKEMNIKWILFLLELKKAKKRINPVKAKLCLLVHDKLNIYKPTVMWENVNDILKINT